MTARQHLLDVGNELYEALEPYEKAALQRFRRSFTPETTEQAEDALCGAEVRLNHD